MKKFLVLFLLISILSPSCFAASSFKTYTPTSGHRYHRHYPHYNYNNYPHNNNYNRYYGYNRRNPYNNYPNYNKYYPNNRYYPNNSYYYNGYPYDNDYYQKSSFFGSIKDFFSGGKVTGYTPSYNASFDIPYGYQKGFYDSNGNYLYGNQGYQNGASIKILD